LKLCPLDKGENISSRFFGEKNRIAALIFDDLGLAADEDKSIGVSQRDALHCLRGGVRAGVLLRIRNQDCRECYEQSHNSTEEVSPAWLGLDDA
jgi:hypothetical protein